MGTSNVDGQVAVYSVETGEWRTLLAGRAPRYSQGHVVAARGDSLWAASFDLDTLELTGDPFLVLEGAAVGAPGTTQFDVSRDGTLIYAPEGMLGGRPDNTIVSVDLQGASTPLLEEPRSYVAPRFSPDGRRLFVQLFGDDGNQVWVHDVERGTLSPFATEPPYNGFPVPAPDGEHVAFSGGAERNLYSRRVDGSGETTVLLEKAGRQYPESWSPNGDVLAFLERHPETGSDIWMLSADGTAEPFMVTDAAEPAARFSNDGRWVAYQTDESGRSEVWLTPYPGPGPTHQVSTNGGTSPQWSPDGRELFYVTEEGELMSVVVDTEPEVALGAPRLIFEDLDLTGPLTDQFAVHPDGDRFAVVLRLDAAAGRTQINVILNWTAELVSPFSN